MVMVYTQFEMNENRDVSGHLKSLYVDEIATSDAGAETQYFTPTVIASRECQDLSVLLTNIKYRLLSWLIHATAITGTVSLRPLWYGDNVGTIFLGPTVKIAQGEVVNVVDGIDLPIFHSLPDRPVQWGRMVTSALTLGDQFWNQIAFEVVE